MRYTLKEEVIFIHVDYTPASLRFSSKYYPWEDKLNNITLSKLTCTEHHRVPGEWDDEIKYDGFIFTDQNNQRWNNQYPRAAYSQTSNAQDYVVRTVIDKKLKKMTDLSVYLNDVNWGIRDLEKELIKAKTPKDKAEVTFFISSLRAHFEDLRFRLIEEFNLEAVEKEHNLFEGFYEVTIQEIKEEDKPKKGVLSDLGNRTIYTTQAGGRCVRDADGYIFTEAPPNQSFMVDQRVPTEWKVQPLEMTKAIRTHSEQIP